VLTGVTWVNRSRHRAKRYEFLGFLCC
jgi:hypothetical protein